MDSWMSWILDNTVQENPRSGILLCLAYVLFQWNFSGIIIYMNIRVFLFLFFVVQKMAPDSFQTKKVMKINELWELLFYTVMALFWAMFFVLIH